MPPTLVDSEGGVVCCWFGWWRLAVCQSVRASNQRGVCIVETCVSHTYFSLFHANPPFPEIKFTGCPLISCTTRGGGRIRSRIRSRDHRSSSSSSGGFWTRRYFWSTVKCVFIWNISYKKIFNTWWSVLCLEMVNSRIDLWIFRSISKFFIFLCDVYRMYVERGDLWCHDDGLFYWFYFGVLKTSTFLDKIIGN